MTSPLPPTAEDPSIIKGQQLKAGFTPKAQAIRQNDSLNDLAVAEQVSKLWESTNAELSSLFEDLQKRRRARIETLETLVPLGPLVPAGASAADAAVINQAFRAALTEARDAAARTTAENIAVANAATGGNTHTMRPATTTLDALLADAEKFDDDNLRRAVLTAAWETGHMEVVRSWTDHMGVTRQLDEFSELQDALAGRGIHGGWNFTALSPIKAPPEVAKLAGLQAAEARAIEIRRASTITHRR